LLKFSPTSWGAERYPSSRMVFGPDMKKKKAKRCSRRPPVRSRAYKAGGSSPALLVKQGHDVFVVMTKDATEFITPPQPCKPLSKNPVTTGFL